MKKCKNNKYKNYKSDKVNYRKMILSVIQILGLINYCIKSITIFHVSIFFYSLKIVIYYSIIKLIVYTIFQIIYS